MDGAAITSVNTNKVLFIFITFSKAQSEPYKISRIERHAVLDLGLRQNRVAPVNNGVMQALEVLSAC
jgi:hypothetical protein